MSERFILDASAVLAFVHDEPGREAVADVLSGAFMSAVNLAEVVSKLAQDGVPAAKAQAGLLSTGLRIVEFDEEQAQLVGELRPLTRSQGLSLGDRCCLALTRLRGGTALTTERRWEELSAVLSIAIRNIRPVS